MKQLLITAILLLSAMSSAYNKRIMSEYIDMASSSVTITHELFEVQVGSTSMTQSFGKSVHSLGMLEPRIHIRIYNLPIDKMPTQINRDAYNPLPVEIDKFLVFETSYELSQLSAHFPPQ